MKAQNNNRGNMFLHAWEIIQKDHTIPADEKEGILKLIQALIEATETPLASEQDNGQQIKTFTQEIISKHSLMTLVKQQADELDALKRLSLNLTSSLDLQTVLDEVVAEAMRLVKNALAAHIFLFHDGRLEFGASLNNEKIRNKLFSLPRDSGLTQQVAQSGQQIVVEDISKHPLYHDASSDWTGSIIGIPLKFSNSIVGVMNLSRSIVGGFTRSELRLLGLLSDQAAVAISNASLHKQVTDQANTDSVTGLPNRRALDERLQEEIRYARRMKTQFSVVMMDLDGFKLVNDTHGHTIGDEILHSAFNYLAQNMRTSDFLARYGGDELTLILRDADLEETKVVTQKIINLMANFLFSISTPNNTYQIKLGITAGIAVYPIHSQTAGDLLRAADTALYQAKKRHRGSYMVATGATGPLSSITVNSPSN